MNRTPLDYFRDGLEAMQKAQEFVEGMDYTRPSGGRLGHCAQHGVGKFVQDDKTSFAVVRALEITGEAAKHVQDAHCMAVWGDAGEITVDSSYSASDAREQNGARIQGTIAPQEVVTIVVTVE